MDENFDISEAVENVRRMISTEDGQETVRNILSMFNSDNSEGDTGGDSSAANDGMPFSDFADAETLSKLQSVLSVLNTKRADAQTEFLTALKPFLSERRQDKVDKALKMMSVARAVKIFKSAEGGS